MTRHNFCSKKCSKICSLLHPNRAEEAHCTPPESLARLKSAYFQKRGKSEVFPQTKIYNYTTTPQASYHFTVNIAITDADNIVITTNTMRQTHLRVIRQEYATC